MGRFEDKTIVITGGSGGIGLASAERLVSEGARVLATGTNPDKLAAAAERVPGLHTLRNDAGDPEAAIALADWVREHFGTIDGLFLNAGYGLFVGHEQVTPEQFSAQFDVNLRGPILHARALSGLINDGGAIAVNTSVVQDFGMPGALLYGASKAALRNVVRVLGRELSRRNVRVNAVSPGPIGTDFFSRTNLGDEQVSGMAEGIKAQVPLGRFGEASEVAGAVAFLLSEDASFMTGSEVVVDGGMSQM